MSKKTKRRSKKGIKIAVIITIVLILSIVLPILYTSYLFVKPYDGADRVSDGIIPSKVQIANFQSYDRVVIVGVDGAGAYFGEGVTPYFDEIFANGCVSYTGTSQKPTISAENWTSMFTGVQAQKHQITNAKASVFPYKSKEYPTVFKIYADRHPEATFGSYCDWAAINVGIIENITNVDKHNPKNELGDNASMQRIIDTATDEAISNIDRGDKITFVHFDNVDHAGHSVGYGGEGFVEQLKAADVCIGRLYQAYVDKGLIDNTLFIVVSDHGHTLVGGHGGEQVTEKQVTIALAGGDRVIKGTCGKYVTQDLASIILFALGEGQPENFDGRVPYNMFYALG